MKTIVFFDSNKSGSSREAIRAADRLGYFTVLLTDRRRFAKQLSEFPDVQQMIFVDLNDLRAVRSELEMLKKQGRELELIVSFIDGYVATAAHLNEEFCNNRLSIQALVAMEDKIKTRQALQHTPYQAQHIIYDGQTCLEKMIREQTPHLPLIIKSPHSTGSKDVLLAQDEEALRTHLLGLFEKYPTSPILIEEYLDGPQYLVEVLVHQGRALPVAVIAQEITQDRRFIISGYSVQTELPDEFRTVLFAAVQSIVEAFGMHTGACHLEMRHVRGQWKLIEADPRISGGAMNRMIEAAFGIDQVEQTLRLFLGEEPSLVPTYVRPVFTQYLMVSEQGVLRNVTGIQRATNMPGVLEVFLKVRRGAFVQPPLGMGHRYAYVIATGDTEEAARSNAKQAAAEIALTIKPATADKLPSPSDPSGSVRQGDQITVAMLYDRKDPSRVHRAYAYASVAKAEGLNFFYFTPRRINFEEETINGLFYEDGQWRERTVPFPDIVYQATSFPARGDKQIVNRLKERLPFLNPPVGTKMQLYHRLTKAGTFAHHLVPSRVVDHPSQLLEYLNEYSEVVIKPVKGRQGHGVLLIKKHGKQFLLLNKEEVLLYSTQELTQLLATLCSQTEHLMQPFIRSRTKSGNACDFRLHIQKNGQGQWIIASIYPRVAPTGSMVTNLSAGGYTNYAKPFLKQEFGAQAAEIQRRLTEFALSLGAHMDQLYGRPFDELGIDVGIDSAQRIWLYEVNWLPGAPPSFYLELDIVRNSLSYAAYLVHQKN